MSLLDDWEKDRRGFDDDDGRRDDDDNQHEDEDEDEDEIRQFSESTTRLR